MNQGSNPLPLDYPWATGSINPLRIIFDQSEV